MKAPTTAGATNPMQQVTITTAVERQDVDVIHGSSGPAG